MDSSREAGTLLFSFLICFYSQWPVFTCACSVFRAPPTLRGETQRGGAKADRCGRIDLQVPAPPQEDTALHRRSDRWSGDKPTLWLRHLLLVICISRRSHVEILLREASAQTRPAVRNDWGGGNFQFLILQ